VKTASLSKTNSETSLTLTADTSSSIKPVHVNDNELSKLIRESKKPVLVDFWAPWCGPCRMLEPTIDDIAKKYSGKVIVVKVNVDKNALSSKEYKIRGIPAILVFNGGKIHERLMGYRPLKDYENILDKLLNRRSQKTI